jgi:hypothetical protein
MKWCLNGVSLKVLLTLASAPSVGIFVLNDESSLFQEFEFPSR